MNEMDIGSIGVGIIIVLACIWPIVMLSRSRTKRNEQLAIKLKTFASSHKQSITELDVWSNTAIGINANKQHLFFVRMHNEQTTPIAVNLSTIQSCSVNKNIRNGGTGSDSYSVLEQLSLELQPFIKGQPAILLPCYDANEDSASLTGQLQVVDKWRTIIQNILDNKV